MLQRRKQIKRYPAVASAVFAALLLAGCASPGVPRPPSLHLPAVVRDLSALRVGSAVQLRFSAPDETTDHQELMRKGQPVPLKAIVCRVQGASCQEVERLAVSPGQAVETADTLPPPLTVGPGRAVAYRVRVENAAGRDAGLSREALAAAGAAPAPVAGLAATTAPAGIQLTWQPLSSGAAPVRVEATAAPGDTPTSPAFGKPPLRSGIGGVRLLRVPADARDPGGATDPTPAVGVRTTYRVYRQRDITVNGEVLPLQGSATTVSVVRSADTFAPAAPRGLLAVSFSADDAGASVSLSWEPNSEPDIAGYQIYRAVGAGIFSRMTQTAVAGVTFQDTAATGLRSGVHARYVVTAVDRSGNESARSPVTEVDVR